jgi:hypothetical protein
MLGVMPAQRVRNFAAARVRVSASGAKYGNALIDCFPYSI